jgi:hypothetical protein
MCFCDYECAGTYISLIDEKQTETEKNEHESGTCTDQSMKVKAEPKEDLRDLRFIRFDPWLKFLKIFTFSPQSFRIRQLWSFKDIFAEVTKWVLRESRNCNKSPWIIF